MTDETAPTNGGTASNDAFVNPATQQPLEAAAPVSAPAPVPAPVPIPAPVSVPVPEPVPVPVSTPPAAPPPAVPAEGTAQKPADDIARILEEVKLPGRREPALGAGTAPQAPKVFDTMLGAAAARALDTSTAPAEANPLIVQSPAPASPAAAPAPETEASVKVSGNIPRLHTLKDDLQGVVREKKISLVRAVALEEEKKRGQGYAALPETSAQKERSHRMFLVGLSAVAVLIIGGGALGAYLITRIEAPAPAAQGTSLFFAEKTVAFPVGALSGIELKRSLAQIRGTLGGALGTVTRIVPSAAHTDATGATPEQPMTIGEFLQAVSATVTPDLVRAFTGDFFLGVHTIDKNAPVLVIPVSSYERAFAGMLAWEPTMNADLAPFFTAVPSQVLDANGLPVARQFQDAIISNYDARVLRDDSGAIELLYSFPSRGMLIIAESPNSFGELLSRLRASRQL